MGTRKDGIRRQRDKLRRSRRGVGIGIRPPRIDQPVSAVGPPELLECCSERCEASVPLRIALGESHQHADAPHPIRPLRTRRERPRDRRAAEQRDEMASSQGWHGLPRAAGFPTLSLARRDGPVLGATLNRSESVGSRRELAGREVTHLFAQWLYRGDDACGGERAADPLHCPGIDPEAFGNDAHTGPARSRQGLADSFFECWSNRWAAKAFTLTPGPRKSRCGSFPP